MYINPIQNGIFWGCSRMGVGAKSPPSLKPVTHILQWWNFVQSYLTLKRSKKYMNHVTHLMSPADISSFSREISKFCYIKKYMYRLYFDAKFLILLTFLKSLKMFLIKKVTIVMISAKMVIQDSTGWYFEIKAMTSYFMSMTPPTKFYHVVQIILWMWSYNQSLVTLTFLWEKLL